MREVTDVPPVTAGAVIGYLWFPFALLILAAVVIVWLVAPSSIKKPPALDRRPVAHKAMREEMNL